MIRLGLRLTLHGGRESLVRLIVTATAVALGVGLLLITLAGINGVNAQNARYSWLNTGAIVGTPLAANDMANNDPVWWSVRGDNFDGKLIGRVDVAGTGPTSPIPPGIPRLPAAGEYYASPALSKLLQSTPSAQLGDRFPGKQVGVIGDAALPAPNSLVIIIGRSVDEMAQIPGAKPATSISTVPPDRCNNNDCVPAGIDANGIDLVLAVMAGALFFPVLIFIGTATRLSAARREQRFAAMRLFGATPQQISTVSAVESCVAAVIGMAFGFVVFFALRSPLAAIPFTGSPFFTSDLSLSLADVATVVIGVPVASVLAARLALRRVQITPLGVSRQTTPPAPRAYRLIPLLLGIGELALASHIRLPKTSSGQIHYFVPGFLLIMAGLVIAGPWLVMVGARIMARRTRRPATLIAGRRLSDNPKAGFRAISGLILALFITSASVGVITSIIASREHPQHGKAANATIYQHFIDPPVNPTASLATFPASTMTQLRSIPGVQGVTLIYQNPHGDQNVKPPQRQQNPPGGKPTPSGNIGSDKTVIPIGEPLTGLVSCADLVRTPSAGHCAAGASVAEITPSIDFVSIDSNRAQAAALTWPDANVSVASLQGLPVQSVMIGGDGSSATIEQARTVLENAFPNADTPLTLGEVNSRSEKLLTQWKQLANVVILTSLPIAGCTLAISVAASLGERKRPFSLLRLTGVPISMLRNVVALEAAVPLIAIAVISAGTGLLAARLFLRAQLQIPLLAPQVSYYLINLAGVLLSLGVIASTLPLLERITGPENARND